MEWKEIIANHVSDTGLTYIICKIIPQLKNKKINNPIRKWAKSWNTCFSKDIPVTNKHMKRC